MQRITWPGAVLALSVALASYSASQILSPLIISGSDPGIHVRMTGGEEGYYLAETVLPGGGVRKLGVLAFTWHTDDPDTGIGTINLHATEMVSGTPYDRYLWVGKAGRGQTFFPETEDEDPGVRTVKVNGKVYAGHFAHDANVGVLSAYKSVVEGGAGAVNIRPDIGSEGSECLVSGQSGTKRFVEKIVMLGSGNHVRVIADSVLENGSPTQSRTYTISSYMLRLALGGSDTYTIRLTCMGGDESTQ